MAHHSDCVTWIVICVYVYRILILQNIPEKLKRYYRKAKPTGKKLGHGTYGIVLELESAGETFAGKVFKNMPQNSSEIEESFHAEIILMATFQHPSLVRFIGGGVLPAQPI